MKNYMARIFLKRGWLMVAQDFYFYCNCMNPGFIVNLVFTLELAFVLCLYIDAGLTVQKQTILHFIFIKARSLHVFDRLIYHIPNMFG